MTRIGEIRSLVPAHVGMMALTATATRTLRVSIASILGMRHPTVIAVSPCKHNIMYAVESYVSLESSITPFVNKIKTERAKMPRTIIYCRTYSDCADVYLFFKKNAWKIVHRTTWCPRHF